MSDLTALTAAAAVPVAGAYTELGVSAGSAADHIQAALVKDFLSRPQIRVTRKLLDAQGEPTGETQETYLSGTLTEIAGLQADLPTVQRDEFLIRIGQIYTALGA